MAERAASKIGSTSMTARHEVTMLKLLMAPYRWRGDKRGEDAPASNTYYGSNQMRIPTSSARFRWLGIFLSDV